MDKVSKTNDTLLTAKVYKIFGRQRLACILSLSKDGIVTITTKKKQEVTFTAPAKELAYSASWLTKARIMLSSNKDSQLFIRIGVMKILQSNPEEAGKAKPREVLINELSKFGTTENPNHPEERIDRFFVKVAAVAVLVLVIVLAVDAFIY